MANKKTTITLEDYVKANRCGEFEANKDIVGRTKKSVFKSKKTYTRKNKHK